MDSKYLHARAHLISAKAKEISARAEQTHANADNIKAYAHLITSIAYSISLMVGVLYCFWHILSDRFTLEAIPTPNPIIAPLPFTLSAPSPIVLTQSRSSSLHARCHAMLDTSFFGARQKDSTKTSRTFRISGLFPPHGYTRIHSLNPWRRLRPYIGLPSRHQPFQEKILKTIRQIRRQFPSHANQHRRRRLYRRRRTRTRTQRTTALGP